MKTEQEQRQAIRQILFDANDICQATPCENEYCIYHGDYRCYDNVIVDKLIKAGYGDVSEYKAEVKRLKEVIEVFKNDTECNLNHITVENGQLKAKNKVLKDGIVKAFTNGFNEGRKQVEKDIRRAKIDILNEVKKCSQCDNFFPDGNWHRYVLVSDIDELIKEIENDK